MNYIVTELLTDKHVDDVVAMGKVFAAECGPHLEYSEEEVRNTCQTVLSDVDREYLNIFLVYRDDEPIGMLVAYCGKYFFNKQRYGYQELLYIRPAFRGTKAFLKLLRAYEEWARLRSAVEIFTGTTYTRALSDILQKIGYPVMGTIHKKRVV